MKQNPPLEYFVKGDCWLLASAQLPPTLPRKGEPLPSTSATGRDQPIAHRTLVRQQQTHNQVISYRTYRLLKVCSLYLLALPAGTATVFLCWSKNTKEASSQLFLLVSSRPKVEYYLNS